MSMPQAGSATSSPVTYSIVSSDSHQRIAVSDLLERAELPVVEEVVAALARYPKPAGYDHVALQAIDKDATVTCIVLDASDSVPVLVDYLTVVRPPSVLVARSAVPQHLVALALKTVPGVDAVVILSGSAQRDRSALVSAIRAAALCPQKPLCDPLTYQPSGGLLAALNRIFGLFDRDVDGVWNDAEFSYFQDEFDSENAPQRREDLRLFLRRSTAGGVTMSGVTENGFIALIAEVLRAGRADAVWALLRRHAYKLNDGRVVFDEQRGSHAASSELVTVSAELTEHVLSFLADLHEARVNQSRSTTLSQDQLQQLFAGSPCGMPWPSYALSIGDAQQLYNDPLVGIRHAVRHAAGGGLTLDAFLSLWALTAFVDPNLALQHLTFLGFHERERPSLRLFRVRSTRENRTVIGCHVMAAQWCDPVRVLSQFVGHDADTAMVGGHARVCGMVSGIEQKMLVMTALAANDGLAMLAAKDVEISRNCDVAMLVFDAARPKSFETVQQFTAAIFELGFPLPCVVVALNADKAHRSDAAGYKAYCLGVGLRSPLPVNGEQVTDAVFALAVRAVTGQEHPDDEHEQGGFIVQSASTFATRVLRHGGAARRGRMVARVAGAVAVGAAVVAGCVWLWRWWRSDSTSVPRPTPTYPTIRRQNIDYVQLKNRMLNAALKNVT